MENCTEGCESDCEDECEDKTIRQICKCMGQAEHESRFILRLLEALRELKYEDKILPSSTIEEIVEYFAKNYRDVGDLYAQVRTSLNQACSQGLAMELIDEYYFIGPLASSMNRSANCQDQPQCLACSSPKNESTEAFSGKRFNKKELDYSKSSRILSSVQQHTRQNNRNSISSSTSDCSVCQLESQKNTKQYKKSSNKATHQRYSVRKKGQSCSRNSSGRCTAENDFGNEKQYEKDSSEEDSLSQNTDELYEKTMDDNTVQRSKTREKELKNWIKRCRKKCQEQKER